MYDVIVVGARCAGSATAMLLARRGYRVLLADRTTFPSDTISTHSIHNAGVACLKRWGLLDKVVASGCPPTVRYVFHFGPLTLGGLPPAANGVAEAYSPRRIVLDKILVDAAVDAGAELQEGLLVESILTDGDRVVGIRGRVNGGPSLAERAPLVVGADGVRSTVGRLTGAQSYNEHPPGACYYYSYWSGVPIEDFQVYFVGGRFLLAFPTNDRLVGLAVAWSHHEFHKVRGDVQANFLEALALAPELAERVGAGKREERFVGTADTPNFFRRPYGPGWALVGDAGYHKDPCTAQGITDAFHDAELLAEAIDAGYSGRRPLQVALAEYERQRNERVMPMYELTCELATLQPPRPDMQRVLAALEGNEEETSRLFGTIAGTVRLPEFLSPDNIQRILGAAGHRPGGAAAVSMAYSAQ